MSLKLISVNIEWSKHLERVLPFLEKEQPDILCLQELHERDMSRFETLLGARSFYAPMTRLPNEDSPTGIAILSRSPMKEQTVEFYRGPLPAIVDFDETSPDTKYATEQAMFLRADIEDATDGSTYRVGTTHFTWTPDGQPDNHQRQDLQKLLPIIESAGEIVFAGDFNAPRGGEIFTALAAKWTDNIPPLYETSIDINLHRAGKAKPHELKNLMVDGLFTTPAYFASEVKLFSGVSDHMAIVAHITKL